MDENIVNSNNKVKSSYLNWFSGFEMVKSEEQVKGECFAGRDDLIWILFLMLTLLKAQQRKK